MINVKTTDLLTGRELWSRQFKMTNGSRTYSEPIERLYYSPDGKQLAINPQIGMFGGDPMETTVYKYKDVVLVNAASGEDMLILAGPSESQTIATGYSHDGHLIAGRALDTNGGGRESRTVRIWDVGSGKLLKSWGGEGYAKFSPKSPMLAIVENLSELSPGDPQKRNYTSTLGIWDVSALRK